MALWGGRFTQAADQRFKQFNDSLRFDYRLAEQDIVGSVAWSKALVTVGVLTAEEQQQLENARMTVRGNGPFVPAGAIRNRLDMQEFRSDRAISLAIEREAADLGWLVGHSDTMPAMIEKCNSLQQC